MSPNQKKHLSGTLHHKRCIVERVTVGSMTPSEAAGELRVCRRTISRMCRQQDQKRLVGFQGGPSRIRVRYGKFHHLEVHLATWIAKVNNHYRYIKAGCSMAVICTKARELVIEMGLADFAASTSWFSRFQGRFDLVRFAMVKRGASLSEELHYHPEVCIR